jgi:hypothetical protein
MMSVFLLLGFAVPWAISKPQNIARVYSENRVERRGDSKVMFSWDVTTVFKSRNQNLLVGKQSAGPALFSLDPVANPSTVPSPEAFDPVYLLVVAIIGSVIAFAPTIPAQFKAVTAMVMLLLWFLFDGWLLPAAWLFSPAGSGFAASEDVQYGFLLVMWGLYLTGLTGSLMRYGKPGRLVGRVTSLLAVALVALGVFGTVQAEQQGLFLWMIAGLEKDLSILDKVPFILGALVFVASGLLSLATLPVVWSKVPSNLQQDTHGPGGPHATYVVARRGDLFEGLAGFIMVAVYATGAVLLSIQVQVALVGAMFLLIAIGVHVTWLMGTAAFFLATIMGVAVPPGYRISQAR